MVETTRPPRGDVSSQAGEAVEAALPELEFKQLVKSQHPVGEVEGKQKAEIKQVKSFGDATIVVLGNPANRIEIFDGKGRKEDDFDKIGSLIRRFDWGDAKKKFGKPGHTYVGLGPDEDGGMEHGQVTPRNELPLIYRNSPKVKELKRHSWTIDYVSLANAEGARNISVIPNKISVLENGRYLLLTDTASGNYLIYETKNPAGTSQPPRNWKLLDTYTNTISQIPDQLAKEAQHSLDTKSKTVEVNEYVAVVADEGVSVYKGGDTKNSLFSDKVQDINNNLCIDPSAAGVVYYCRSNNPADLVRIDLRRPLEQWAPEAAPFPQMYAEVENLQLDPSGNFFIFYSGKDLVVLAKDTLREIKKVPNLTHVNFDDQGRIRAVDENGYLVVLETNFDAIAEALERQKATRLVSAVDLGDIFSVPGTATATKKGAGEGEGLERLNPARDKYVADLRKFMDQAKGLGDIMALRQKFPALAVKLQAQGLRVQESDYIITALEAELRETEQPLATDAVLKTIDSVRTRLAGGVSLSAMMTMRDELDRLNNIETLVDRALLEDLRLVRVEVEKAATEIFQREGEQIKQQIGGLVEGSRRQLEQFTSLSEFNEWEEYEFPALKKQLNSLLQQCPLQAAEAFNFIKETSRALIALDTEYREKFEREYAVVRQKAVERYGDIISTLKDDVARLVERLSTKGFKDRAQAEAYLAKSPARQSLEAEITTLAAKFPAEAEELRRGLDVKISNELFAIERGASVSVAETGERMVPFGKVAFPEWAAKVKAKEERKVELSFKLNDKAAGAGVKGDLVLNITNSDGTVETVRLFEGLPEEDEMRLGFKTYRGAPLPASLLEGSSIKDLREQFKQIKADYIDWQKGDQSPLRKEYDRRREELHAIAARRPKKSTTGEAVDRSQITEEYAQKLQEFGAFCVEHHISALRRADTVRETPAVEHENGIGSVPEWKNHWVRDPETEHYLEIIAEEAKGQLRRKEGVINLTGHAGTGKDVLVNMFCAVTKRPKFTFDASKWTTEMDLAEDVMLTTEDGATTSVRLPSAFLYGMQTPGAVVYVNEFNAMPEVAQIFLHAPFDEKRTMTVKTRGGKAVPVAEGVIFMSSENPNYPGTFEPQMATESRRIPIKVDYPPLMGEPAKGDANQNKPYNVSEALRVAREVKSLRDLTIEQSMERNEFVKLWDNYVNGIKNGAIKPSAEQEFDLNTIMALVQFGDKLRTHFIATYEKKRTARDGLKVKQPLTGRELRRCADALSQVPVTEKNKGSEEEMARFLLKRYYLSHVSNTEEEEKIATEMAGWSSQKRVGV